MTRYWVLVWFTCYFFRNVVNRFTKTTPNIYTALAR